MNTSVPQNQLVQLNLHYSKYFEPTWLGSIIYLFQYCNTSSLNQMQNIPLCGALSKVRVYY